MGDSEDLKEAIPENENKEVPKYRARDSLYRNIDVSKKSIDIFIVIIVIALIVVFIIGLK